jgi:hypothetical protein
MAITVYKLDNAQSVKDLIGSNQCHIFRLQSGNQYIKLYIESDNGTANVVLEMKKLFTSELGGYNYSNLQNVTNVAIDPEEKFVKFYSGTRAVGELIAR